MQVTVDSAGRLVIPKSMRDHLGLHGSATVDIDLSGDHLEIRTLTMPARLVSREGKFVFTTDADVPPLTDSDVRRLLEEGRS